MFIKLNKATKETEIIYLDTAENCIVDDEFVSFRLANNIAETFQTLINLIENQTRDVIRMLNAYNYIIGITNLYEFDYTIVDNEYILQIITSPTENEITALTTEINDTIAMLTGTKALNEAKKARKDLISTAYNTAENEVYFKISNLANFKLPYRAGNSQCDVAKSLLNKIKLLDNIFFIPQNKILFINNLENAQSFMLNLFGQIDTYHAEIKQAKELIKASIDVATTVNAVNSIPVTGINIKTESGTKNITFADCQIVLNFNETVDTLYAFFTLQNII